MITIRLETDNAAFGDTFTDRYQEVARIMQKLADDYRDNRPIGNLYDLNGNNVGTVTEENDAA